MTRRSALRPVLLATAVVTVALALTACGSDGAKASDATTTTSPAKDTTTTTAMADGPAVPSAGCATATPVADLESRTIPVADVERRYLITAPASAPDAEPMPLVLDLHGLVEGSTLHAEMSKFGELATAEGFIAVFPHGAGEVAHWSALPFGAAELPNVDIDFMTALLDELEATQCVDTSRVYATGLSHGAMMSSLMACFLSDRLAAVAPVAGATAFDDCNPTEPMPMMTIHGTADPILLFNGGLGELVRAILGDTGTAPVTTTIPTDVDGPGYPTMVTAWAERNGCDPDPTDSEVSDEVTLRTYDCPAGADVEMYVVLGGGHSWPGSEFSKNVGPVIGPTTFDIDATKVIWEFFQRFRRA